jgi:hypothetical protein
MGGQGGSIAAIVLGVVIGVVAIATGQLYLLFSAAMLVAGGAFGLAYQPKAESTDQLQSQELRVATAATGSPVPVVFGEARLTPNWLRYDLSTFRIEDVFGEQPRGGKGMGGSKQKPQVIGYDYFLTWEEGLCMGPVDAVGQVWSMPGEVPMVEGDNTWQEFGSADHLDIALAPVDTTGDAEGGMMRIYRGSHNQDRESTGDPYAADGVPYRNICWCLRGLSPEGWLMGRMAQPRTYQVLIRRLPKPSRDNGDAVDGLVVRGSHVTSDGSYNQANPAAVIYEILTNKVWGRGLSSDIINESSFVVVSEYYADRNIGISYVMERQGTISDVLEGIYRQCKCLLTWDGEQYKLQCLLDTSFTHFEMVTLRSRDLSALKVTVPTWETNTINDLRGEYISAQRSYRPDLVHAQDLAAIDAVGGRLISERINVPSFSDHNLARQQLTRILAEMSYPFMSAQWEQNRFGSHLAVGEVVRIIWDEWTESPVTSYWMIVKIEDGASDSENIMVTAVQDQVLFPVEGEETEVDIPTVHPWERLVPIDDEEIYRQSKPDVSSDPIDPVTAIELSAIVTGGGEHRVIIAGEKMNPLLLALQGLWSIDDDVYTSLGSTSTLAITGELTQAMTGHEGWNRDPSGIEFELTAPERWGDRIQEVVAVQGDIEDLSVLLMESLHWLIVDEEIMQVGLIEHVSGDTYRLRNVIRGRLGSAIRQHAAGAKVFYLRQPSGGFDGRGIPVGEDVWFQAIPIGPRGAAADGVPFQPFHYGDLDGKYLARGVCPMSPEPMSISEAGGTVTLTARPRFYRGGAENQGTVDAMRNPIASLGAMTFAVQELDAAGVVIGEIPLPVDHDYTPGTLESPGAVQIEFEKDSASVAFRLFSAENGRTSVEWAEFSL